MKRALSTLVCGNERLSVVWLQKVLQAGISAVEIYCSRQHFDYRDKAQVREIALWFRDSELELHSLHSPTHSDVYGGLCGPESLVKITESDKGNRIRMTDEIKRAIEVSELIPVKCVVQHMGVVNEEFSERKSDAAFTALEELKLFSKQRGVNLMLENIPNGFSTAERLNYFNGTTHLDLGYVFDTGHANLSNGVKPEWELMKSRVRSIHVHDNNGKDDLHLQPIFAKEGTVNWERTMELFRDHGDKYPLMLELKTDPEIANPLDSANRIFDALEKA